MAISKPIIFLHIFLLYSTVAVSQSWQEEIIKKTAIYQSIHHKEKIFIQLDRPLYKAGEEVWFSAFVFNSASNKLNTSEKVLYIEFINPDGISLHKHLFEIDNGRATGSIPIPENIKPGCYQLVAFTNWMRNAGSEYFFSQPITIISNHATLGTKHVSETYTKKNDPLNQVNNSAVGTDQAYQVKFFPEGGKLIEGIQCKVAFEAHNAHGTGTPLNGLIIDDRGKIITAAYTLWQEKGIFSFIPEKDRRYYLHIDSENDSLTNYSLPPIHSNGLALAISENERNQSIQIQVSRQGAKPEYSSVFLLGMQHELPISAIKIDLQGVTTRIIEIEKSVFKTGIVQFTLFDANQRPLAERLLFVNNNEQLKVELVENKLPNKARDNASFVLEVADQEGNPVVGSFAVSVTDAAQIPDYLYQSPNMIDYLALNSDLPNFHESIPLLTSNTRTNRFKTELLMLTNGWRNYNWKEVLNDTLTLPVYFEEPGIYVDGKVRKKRNQSKIPKNVIVSMVSEGEKMEFFNSPLKDDGSFTFLLDNFNDSLRAIIQTKNTFGDKKDFHLDLYTNYQKRPGDDYSALANFNISEQIIDTTSEANSLFYENEILAKKLQRKILNDTFLVETGYLIPEVLVEDDKVESPKEQITSDFGSPNYSVGQETIKELQEQKPWYDGLISLLTTAFPNLELTVSYDSMTSITFNVIGQETTRIFVFVDGIMVAASLTSSTISGEFGTYTVDDLIAMDPNVVDRVDFILPQNNEATHKLNQMSNIYYTQDEELSPDSLLDLETMPVSILSIYTKGGAGLYTKNNYKGVANITLRGFTKVKEFYQPDYHSYESDSIFIDLRKTLAWYPNIETDSSGHASFSFFTSDVSDQFRIELNGVSKDGQLGSLRYNSDICFKESKVLVKEYTNDSNSFEKEDILENTTVSIPETYQNNAIADSATRTLKASYKFPNDTMAYTFISSQNANFYTYSSPSGYFLTNPESISDTTLLTLSCPGYKDSIMPYESIDLGDMHLVKSEEKTPKISVNKLIKKLYNKRYKTKKYRFLTFEGAYREQTWCGEELYQLSDIGFHQTWPSLNEPNAWIVTQIKDGRTYRAMNFEDKIPFKAQTKNKENIPLMDPVYAKLSFLQYEHRKHYDYKLEGVITYQGRRMYHVTFDQKEVHWALYEGELYIDAENYSLAWASWRISKKGMQYVMPDEYLSSGSHQQSFKVIAEHNEFTWRFDGKNWLPVFGISNVAFSQNDTKYAIFKELAWKEIPEKQKQYKAWNVEKVDKYIKIEKKPVYNPSEWRPFWLLPPDINITNQIKYLNKVEIYK